MDIRINDLINDSIVDGPGIRLTIFTQGCKRACPGCHNPQTHDPNGGRLVSCESIIKLMKENPLLDGITLSGGEPFLQLHECTELAKAAKELGLNVWAYTGYRLEEFIALDNRYLDKFLSYIDVLVDGEFVLAERSLELRFRGSKNQRLIDLKRSLAENTIVLVDETTL